MKKLIFLFCMSTLLFLSPIAKPKFVFGKQYLNKICSQLEDFKVGSNFNLNDQEKPAVAMNNMGEFVIIWNTKNNDKIRIEAQLFENDGSRRGNSFLVNEFFASLYPVYQFISLDDSGKFVIVWEDAFGSIFGQRFAKNGEKQSEVFKVNDDSLRSSFGCSMAMNNTGAFIVAWCYYNKIYAQRFNSEGERINSNFKVNDEVPGYVERNSPVVANDPQGNFVVAWLETCPDNSSGIYGQYYGSNGDRQHMNFKVSDFNTCIPFSYAYFHMICIAMDSSGNYVICWEDRRNGDADIYAKIYNNQGVPQGNDYRVNDDIGSSIQKNCVTAIDEHGNCVITWQDKRNGNFDIYAQRYDITWNAIGTNYKVTNETNTSDQLVPAVVVVNSKILTAWEDKRIPDQAKAIWGNINDFYTSPVKEIDTSFLINFKLHQNYPNPFNPSTTIEFSIPHSAHVSLKIYDVLGKEISTLVEEELPMGQHKVNWNAQHLASGIYIYKIQAGEFVQTRKMILMR